MEKLTPFERRIEIVKLLQGKRMRTGELAEYFAVDERTIRTDIDILRMGANFFGSIIQIESKHEGSQKHYYKSTVHPIIMGLNLSELFMLLKLLEEKSMERGGEVYRNIFNNIYSQITDYAEERIAPRLKNNYDKREIVNLLEEKAFWKSKDYKLVYWLKSGRYIEISYLDDEGKDVYEEVRLNDIKDNELEIEDQDGNKKWVDYGDLVVDWASVDYK